MVERMNDTQEVTIDLNIKVNSDGILHDLGITTEGYNASSTRDVKDIINEDIDYFIEDLRRRVTIIQ
jgi:hypothetical protein